MGRLADLVVGIRGDTKQFEDAIKRSEKTLLAFGKSAARIGRSLTTFVTLPLLGIGTAFAKVAADAEETNSKFNAVFKEQSEVVREWAEAYSRATGRSTIKNIEWLASVQDLFVPLGVARNEATNLSKSVVTLATDISSFNNQPTERVLLDIQSALVGSVITMRKYGVVLNETNLNQELLNMGITGGNQAATAAEKALARLNIILASTKDAQGDAERTAGSFTNRFIALKSSVVDLSESFGNLMLPTLQKLVSVVIKAVRFVDDLDERQQKLILTIAALAAAIGPLLFVVGKLIALFAALSGPAGWIVLASLALIALAIALSDETKEAQKSARWHEELADSMIVYKETVEDTKDAIEALTRSQINAREKEIQLTLRKLKSDQELLGKTIERNQKIIALEQELTELKKWRFIKEIESDEAIKESSDKVKEAKEREKKAQEELNELIKTSTADLQDWITEQTQVVAFTNSLTREQLGLNTQLMIFHDTIDAIAAMGAPLEQATVESNIALKEQLTLFEILNITAAESYRIQVEGAEAAAGAAKQLERVQKQVNNAILSTTKVVVGSMGSIWSNYYSGILMDENLTDEERKKIMRKQAIGAKAFALFDIAINTAVAISKALPNFVLSLLAGVSGAAQAAVVVSQPIPALAEGGIVSRPTLALIGEKGPERITPLDEEPIHVTVMLGGKVLYDDISRASRDRKILIDGRAVV